jgi:capsular polysaccharide biosynthesis protein
LGRPLVHRARFAVILAVITAYIAYVTSLGLGRDYNAEAVLLVPSTNLSDSGSLEEATRLAAAYAQLIPRDSRIARAVTEGTGAAPGAVAGRIGASATSSAPVLVVQFRGGSRQASLAGIRAAVDAVAGPTPASPNIAANSISVVSPPRVVLPPGSRQPIGQAQLLVRAKSGSGFLGNADQADRLAGTYAVLITEDPAILERVALEFGLTTDEVRDRISAVNDFGTSLLRIRFRASTPEAAVAGATYAAELVSDTQPASPRIVPGSISLVQLPELPDEGLSTPYIVAVGALLGLILGTTLVVVWERAHPRVSDADDLSAAAAAPASALRGRHDDTLKALLDRWRELGGRSPTRVALLPADAPHRGATERAAELLLASGDDTDALAARRTSSRRPVRPAREEPDDLGAGGLRRASSERTLRPAERESDVRILIGSAPAAAAMWSDLVVLVAEPGASANAVAATRAALEQFGVRPGWALLVDKRATAPTPRSTSGRVATGAARALEGGAQLVPRLEGRVRRAVTRTGPTPPTPGNGTAATPAAGSRGEAAGAPAEPARLPGPVSPVGRRPGSAATGRRTAADEVESRGGDG